MRAMTSNQTIAPFAAAVYKADTGDRMALLKFVEKQKALHTRVGGLLQEAIFDAEGAITGLNAVDVALGAAIFDAFGAYEIRQNVFPVPPRGRQEFGYLHGTRKLTRQQCRQYGFNLIFCHQLLGNRPFDQRQIVTQA